MQLTLHNACDDITVAIYKTMKGVLITCRLTFRALDLTLQSATGRREFFAIEIMAAPLCGSH